MLFTRFFINFLLFVMALPFVVLGLFLSFGLGGIQLGFSFGQSFNQWVTSDKKGSMREWGDR